MNFPSLSLALLLLILSPLPSWSAPKKQQKPPEESSFTQLLKRISNYLNAEPVRKARISAAVAAVRGGIPTDQGEDLDQRLLDRVFLLRERLLSPSASPEDEKGLRVLYEALAISQWVQSLETASSGTSSADAREALRGWAKESRSPAPPDHLRSLLLDAPASGLNAKALVDRGWGSYCRGLTPPLSGGTPDARLMADPKTARLDELLKSLKNSWLEKKLEPKEEAQAHFLAGETYAQLAKAPLRGVEARAQASGPASAVPSVPAPNPGQASHTPAPKRVVSAAPEGPEQPFEPRRIYGKAAKAVVLILCSEPEGAGELGSGSLIDDSGRILTNAHVVIRDSTRQPWPSVRVFFKPEKMTGDPKEDLANPHKAKVLSWDPRLDLALIQLEDQPAGFSTLSLGNPDEVSVGDRVAAIGHPEQGGLWTLTTGVVSTLAANLGGVKGKNAFQTDASINRGNSGGPLLNASGDIIGVNTLMSRKAADGLAITAVNFAVKSDVARRWLEKTGLPLAYSRSSAAASEIPPASYASAAEKPAPLPAATAAARSPEKASAEKPKVMVTESQPYDREKLIEEEIREMEDMEEEMHQEVIKRTR